jgi:hypothetical protein
MIIITTSTYYGNETVKLNKQRGQKYQRPVSVPEYNQNRKSLNGISTPWQKN